MTNTPTTDESLISTQLERDHQDAQYQAARLEGEEKALRSKIKATVTELERQRGRAARLELAIRTLQETGQ